MNSIRSRIVYTVNEPPAPLIPLRTKGTAHKHRKHRWIDADEIRRARALLADGVRMGDVALMLDRDGTSLRRALNRVSE